MAAITVKRQGTGESMAFDTVAEVGSAAEFISLIKEGWGEGVLLKPSSHSIFTDKTPQPFPHGVYTFVPKSGTAVNTTLHNSYLAACSTGSRPNSVDWCWCGSRWFQLAAAAFALQQLASAATLSPPAARWSTSSNLYGRLMFAFQSAASMHTSQQMQCG